MRARLICSRAAAYIMDQRVQLATAMTLEKLVLSGRKARNENATGILPVHCGRFRGAGAFGAVAATGPRGASDWKRELSGCQHAALHHDFAMLAPLPRSFVEPSLMSTSRRMSAGKRCSARSMPS